MRGLVLGGGLLLLFACAEPGSVQTRIGFGLNPLDTEAAGALVRLEIEIHPPSSVCEPLRTWHGSVCGQAECTPPPAPARPARASVILERSGPRWTPVELRLPDQGPWDVLVRGVDTGRTIFLHGCQTVSSRVPATVRLWRPWCGTTVVCEDVDPLCEEILDCEQIVAETDTTYPPCTVRGKGCRECVAGTSTLCGPPVDAGPNVHCHAQVCAPEGMLEACGGEATNADVCDPFGVDEDCDGEAFGTEAHADCRLQRGDPRRPRGNVCDPDRNLCVCDDGTDVPPECGDDQACCMTEPSGMGCVDIDDDAQNCGACGRICPAGQACAEGQCILGDGGVPPCDDEEERCNGVDDDCDGIPDDGAAITACQVASGDDPPLTDTCRGRAGCGCGEAAPCPAISMGRAQQCCMGRCVIATPGGCSDGT
jgi:hypothetical protein